MIYSNFCLLTLCICNEVCLVSLLYMNMFQIELFHRLLCLSEENRDEMVELFKIDVLIF